MCVSSKTTYSLVATTPSLRPCNIHLSRSNSSRSLLIHTQKLVNTHTAAVKCHTNTFYQPPLTSLIRTVHIKVCERGGERRICFQGFNWLVQWRRIYSSWQTQICFITVAFYSFFFENSLLFLHISVEYTVVAVTSFDIGARGNTKKV